jgi:hypothetical protein
MPNRHVVPTDDGWAVKVPNQSAPESSHRTQAEAERAAKQTVRTAGGGEVVIHRRDGQIRNTDTIPPARDPFPPRDTRH